MTEVPNIRGYEGFGEGATWNKELALRVMLEYINGSNDALNRNLTRWLGTNHEGKRGAEGFNDDEFDAINKDAYNSLLEKKLLSPDFYKIASKIIGDDVGQTARKLLGVELDAEAKDDTEAALQNLGQGVWREILDSPRNFTLKQLLEGRADAFSLEMDLDNDRNKKLVGMIVGETLFSSSDRNVREVKVSEAVARTGLTADVVKNFLTEKETHEGLLQSIEAILQRVNRQLNPVITSFQDGKKVKTGVYEFLQDNLGDLVNDKSLRRGEEESIAFPNKTQEELQPAEWATELDLIPNRELLSFVNKALKKKFQQTFTSLEGSGYSLKDFGTLTDVFKKIDKEINPASVTREVPVEEMEGVGEKDLSITDDELVKWFETNNRGAINSFKQWLKGDNERFSLNRMEWNPAKIIGFEQYTQIQLKRNVRMNNLIQIDMSGKDSGIISAYRRSKLGGFRNSLATFESAYSEDGLMDALVDHFNDIKQLVANKKTKSKEELAEGIEEEDALPVPNITRIASEANKTTNRNEIMNGNESSLNYLDEVVVDFMKLFETYSEDDENKVPSEMVQTNLALMADINTFITASKVMSNRMSEEEVIDYIQEEFGSEVASKLSAQELATATLSEVGDMFEEAGVPEEAIVGEVGQSEESAEFREELIRGFTNGDIDSLTNEEVVKLIFYPLLYNTSKIDDINTRQTKKALPLQLRYIGFLTVNVEEYAGSFKFSYEFIADEKGSNKGYEIKLFLGTSPANFTVKVGAKQEGSFNITPSGEKYAGRFESIFNKEKDLYKQEILNKLLRLDSTMGAQ